MCIPFPTPTFASPAAAPAAWPPSCTPLPRAASAVEVLPPAAGGGGWASIAPGLPLEGCLCPTARSSGNCRYCDKSLTNRALLEIKMKVPGENFIGRSQPTEAKHRHTHTTRLASGSLGWHGTPRGRARSDPPPRLETIATVPWGWAQRGAADDGARTQVARNNGGLCSRIHMHISNLRRCCCRRRPGSRPAL